LRRRRRRDIVPLKSVELVEVGPREGFQFEGIGDPQKISTAAKARLIDALSGTGVKTIEVTSFVSPRAVPQMADAEALSQLFLPQDGVRYTALFLNDRGFQRALATGRYQLEARLVVSASEKFALRNQNRTIDEDLASQRTQAKVFRDLGLPVERCGVMAAFGCNYEGDIPLQRVLDLLKALIEIGEAPGDGVKRISLADTMGWADPEQIKRAVDAIWTLWPQIDISLHLHDTRGMGMANVYAAMEMGVHLFDSSVGGLGGCPFAGVAAGNVATEDIVFMCERLGVETGIELKAMTDCVRLAEEIVGHSLPSKIGHLM
jgi:hydroxymethylglutaryl-CoA lyase